MGRDGLVLAVAIRGWNAADRRRGYGGVEGMLHMQVTPRYKAVCD
jgi:hypothetical protein